MTEEDRLFDFMKGLQPAPKCPRFRGGTGSQPARLKVLSQGKSRPGQGQGPKVSKRQGLQKEVKPEVKNSELKIRSQSGPRRKKEGFICSKPLKKKSKGRQPKNGKSSFLPQKFGMDRPTGNENRMHRSLEGVPISG